MIVVVRRYQARKKATRVAESVKGSMAGYYDKPVKRKKR